MEKFIPNIQTPRVEAASTIPQDPIYKEVHAKAKRELFPSQEKEISETRDFILDKYHVPRENVIIIQPPKGAKELRRIRAFSILKHKTNPDLIFYAEGHTAHAVLFDLIINTNINTINQDRADKITDGSEIDFDEWHTKKGFLDPQQNGFQGFPESRQALISNIKSNRDINGYTKEEFQKIAEGLTPSWFLSGDTEYDEKMEALKSNQED